MTTDSQILAAAESALLKRLNGDAYEAYKTEEQEFIGMKITELRALIKDLRSDIADASGGNTFIEAIP
jgi:hypothetical protein